MPPTLSPTSPPPYLPYLLSLVKDIAARYHANCYVLALEDSCVYWMSKGFVLEQVTIYNRGIHGGFIQDFWSLESLSASWPCSYSHALHLIHVNMRGPSSRVHLRPNHHPSKH